MSALPLWAACMSAVLFSWWKYYNWRKLLSKAHSVIWHSHAQSHIIIYDIKVYNKSNQIKSNQAISLSDWEWYRVIYSERERITNKKRNRLREWKKERKKERNKKRFSEKVKTLEERKIENVIL